MWYQDPAPQSYEAVDLKANGQSVSSLAEKFCAVEKMLRLIRGSSLTEEVGQGGLYLRELAGRAQCESTRKRFCQSATIATTLLERNVKLESVMLLLITGDLET